MNIFDIIGPVMVGPSSSHTAGAARIGYTARKLMGEPIARAEILLYGSFLATGKGHGTDCAIVAGLLGMTPDDERIAASMVIAEEKGMELVFGEADLQDAHSNSVLLKLTGVSGKHLEVLGESVGGSVVNIRAINGMEANFSGELPTLLVYYADVPGRVSEITSMLAKLGVNIARMHVTRADRGGTAAAVIECDQEVPEAEERIAAIMTGMERVMYYSPKEVGV